MKDVPKFTNKPNVYCSVCNLTKTTVMVSKQEHKRKPKYVDDSCRKLIINNNPKGGQCAIWQRHILGFKIARVRSNGT